MTWLVLMPCLASPALAGANPAELRCCGLRSGVAVVLEGEIPGDSADFGRKVFALTVALNPAGQLVLYAEPKTLAATGSLASGKLRARF